MRASDAFLQPTADLLQETQGTPISGAETGAPGGGPESEAPPRGGLGDFMVPMLLILAVFWFVMIGPERKNRKKREEMLSTLKKGDKVMTTSGIYGTVAQVQDSIVTVQIADGVRVRMSLQAVQGLEESKTGEPAKQEKS